MHQAAAVERRRIVRAQHQRLVAILQGERKLSHKRTGKASVAIGFGIIRFQADRLIEVCDGQLLLVFAMVGDAPRVVGFESDPA